MSIEPIRFRELQHAVRANQTLLALESEKARKAHQQIIAIGQELGGAEFDDFLKSRKIEDFSAEELAAKIISIVKASLGLLKSYPNAQKVADINREMEEKKRLVDTQTQRANRAEEQVAALKKQAWAYEKELEELRKKNQALNAAVQASQAPKPDEDFSSWFEQWRHERSFDRDNEVIKLIGKTGWARASQIKDYLAKKLRVDPKTIERRFPGLQKHALIERQGGFSTGGHPTDLIWLNEKGQWTYTKLTGEAPLPSEYPALIKAHKSGRQAGFVLKTRDLFAGLGYAVDQTPTDIKVDENRYFKPDLIVTKDGETFYIEFETGVASERESLSHKWANALAVGGGKICIVTPDLPSMRTTSSNATLWATESGKRVRLYATHIEALKKCRPGESPWVIAKDR